MKLYKKTTKETSSYELLRLRALWHKAADKQSVTSSEYETAERYLKKIQHDSETTGEEKQEAYLLIEAISSHRRITKITCG